MFRKSRPRIATLFVALLLWQAGMQLAHAAVFHTSPGISASEHIPHAAAALQVEVAPCHGDSAPEMPPEIPVVSPEHVSPEHAGHEMPLVDSAAQPQAGAPDCCESLACQCACVHASLGGVMLALMLPMIPEHPASLGMDTPSLAVRIAELFRPPI